MPKHHEIDYASFQSRLAAALREAWQNVRKLRPSETVYMFGLETNDDITVLTVFADTPIAFNDSRIYEYCLVS